MQGEKELHKLGFFLIIKAQIIKKAISKYCTMIRRILAEAWKRNSFVVCEAVRLPIEGIENGFVNLEIPQGKYAVFKVDGPVRIAQNTWRYIYKTWLPNSNYERREGPDFEVTDVCNSVYPEKMSMKIYIPVE